MPDMLMDVDLRKRDSMFEFLIEHKKHGDFNTPQAYAHDVRVRDVIKARNRDKAYKYFDEVFAYFEHLVSVFEKENHPLKIFQTGRSGGHIELYTESTEYDRRREVNGMKHREEIIKALDKADFRAIASDLIENAYPMVDQKGRPCGQMDGILVYDEIGKELEVLSESPSTWTPSFTYLYRLEGNEDYDAMNDDEREELEDNVWEGLSNMYWRIYNEENDE